MVRMTEGERARAIGMIQAGTHLRQLGFIGSVRKSARYVNTSLENNTYFSNMAITKFLNTDGPTIHEQVVVKRKMPSYRFQYFDVRGRGELSRYVFAAAGKEFEDARVPRDGWPAIKPTTPFGQMPVLEVDGKKVAQSQSIARFLAREFGLAGKDSWEQALVDQYMGLVDDMFKEIVKVFFEKDETKKAELQKNLLDEVFPKFLGLFEKGLEKNGGKYFVGNSMTLADLAILDGFDTPVQNTSGLMDKFPKMKAHRAAIAGTANLSAYIQNRKRSDI